MFSASQKSYDPKTFDYFWKPFVRVFQALCLSHYSIFRCSNRTHNVGRLIYTMFFMTLDVVANIYILHQIHSVDKAQYENCVLMYFVSLISHLVHVVSDTIAHFESFFAKEQEEEIYRKHREIDEIFATKLNHIRDYNAIRRASVWPTIIYWTCASIVAFAAALFILPSNENVFVFLIGNTAIMLINRIRRFQIGIHVNALTNILNDLKMLLDKQHRMHCSQSNGISPDFCKNIRYFRQIYSNAWFITKMMSCCFGWSFIIFLFEGALDLIASTYQVYLNLNIYKSTNQIIRNFARKRLYRNKIHSHSFFCLGTVFYQLQVILNLWYLCMISERCQNAVS